LAGSPASIYAGMEISPPPPPIASTTPAKNAKGQTIKNIDSVSSMIFSFF